MKKNLLLGAMSTVLMMSADDGLGGGGAGFESGAAVGLIDFNEVGDDKGFEPLPRGQYEAIVDNVEYGMSKSSGNPMWSWTFTVAEGEFVGRKLFFHTVLTKEQLPRAKKVLSFLAPELLNAPLDPMQVANDGILCGRRAKLRVDIRPYNGAMTNNVRDVMASTGDSTGGSDFLS